MGDVFRPPRKLGPESFKTYAVVAPLSTHFRKATCAEVRCPNYEGGWRVRVEGLPPELVHAARTSGRRHQELRVSAEETWLVFEAGQPCFQATEHRTRIQRPELFLVREGDDRGNPRRTKARLHQRPEHWVEDFAGHQQAIADAIKEG